MSGWSWETEATFGQTCSLSGLLRSSVNDFPTGFQALQDRNGFIYFMLLEKKSLLQIVSHSLWGAEGTRSFLEQERGSGRSERQQPRAGL